MEFHAMLEAVEGFVTGFQPQTYTGFIIALGFLVLVRGMAWVRKPGASSQLATSIMHTLDTMNPAELVENKGGYRYGILSFNAKKGVTNVGGRDVASLLSRKERKQINRKISTVLANQKVYESGCIAKELLGHQEVAPVALSVDEQVQTAFARLMAANNVKASPVATVATPAVTPARTNENVVADCFGGKFKARSIKGVAEQTKLPTNIVASILCNSYKYRADKNGRYSKIA